MDSIDRAGPARLRTIELPCQKSPEVCAQQRAGRARPESRLRKKRTAGATIVIREVRPPGEGSSTARRPLALRPASERLAQRQFDANASQRNRAHDAAGRDARTRVVFAARGFVSLPEGLATAGT